ncbi:MAG: hydrogenase maturation nickel metallochaperone HypA [SAR324 cluster bacterium]|nr:hydrogenase maturation nickel metallochaperone HypA [SAR324 cluster bacterium]
MMSILDTCQQEAEKAGAGRVSKIHLQIGERSGVVVDSLKFVFSMATQDTMAEGAELEIDLIPFEGECPHCNRRFHASAGFLVCDQCGNYAKLIGGQELNIKSIEVED